MKLSFLDEGEALLPQGMQARLVDLGAACLSREGVGRQCHAAILVLDDEQMRTLNRTRRGIDRVTDVLSFPQARFPSGTARDHPRLLAREYDPDVGCVHLGDIALCLPQAKRQALEYGNSLARELGFLFVHGLCHLLGYDHEGKEEQKKMREMEEAALSACGLTRVDEEELLAMARQAKERAYAPYSKYKVGAALLAEDGRVFTGCNVENASYGMTLCAERNAICKAVSEGCRSFLCLAVAADGAAPYPCGACRQVLREFAPDCPILVTWGEETVRTDLPSLLPHSFGPESLP